MNESNRDAARLSFNYPLTAIAGLLVLGGTIALLAWVDAQRADAELEETKTKLCGSNVLDSLEPESEGTKAASWRIWALVDQLLEARAGEHWDVRVLQQSKDGWRQWQRWSKEPEWSYATDLPRLADGSKCTGSVSSGTIRVVRSASPAQGGTLLVVVERKRD